MLNQFAYIYTYTTTVNGQATTNTASVPNSVIATLIVVGVVILALLIVSLWHIFTKAGEKGWKVFIPIYNLYILAEIAGMSGWYGVAIALVSVLGFTPTLVVLTDIVTIAIGVVLLTNLAKAFGRSPWFALWLIILPIIGYPWLAFGEDTYKGPRYVTMPSRHVAPAAKPAKKPAKKRAAKKS